MHEKKPAFSRTCESLGINPDGEYSPTIVECLNILVKKVPPENTTHRSFLLSKIMNGFSTKQLNAAITYLSKHQSSTIDEVDFDKACGIGVTYTEKEISQALTKALAKPDSIKNPYQIVSLMGRDLPWAEHDLLLKIATEQFAEIEKARVTTSDSLVDNTTDKVSETQQSKDLSPTGSIHVPPIAQVLSAIPEKNRYEQLCKYKWQHNDFLKNLGASVLTRFPPEPNGYLHLGHAKAMFISFNYAILHNGKTYLRMDDTNPEAESKEYIDSIMASIKWLGHKPFKFTHTSDYFQRLYDVAVELIRQGKAYACDQTVEEVAKYREERLDPPGRQRSVQENLRIFEGMKCGLYKESQYTLRLKIDMQSDNPNMRDPIAYRIKYCKHPLTGSTWCIYPSYDFSHCLVDAFEHITHSLCTLEFGIRRESYDWVTHNVHDFRTSDRFDVGYRPMQWEFSRLNITHNVMSKRRLLTLVNNKLVMGWDDPRLLTLDGLKRRGYTPTSINTFCQVVGISRSAQTIDYRLLEHVLRLELDPIVERAMAVMSPVRVELLDFGSDPLDTAPISYSLHPKNSEMGTEEIKLERILYIDAEDFCETNTSDFFRLAPGQPVGLRYGPLIVVDHLERKALKNGDIELILYCTHSWCPEEKEEVSKKLKAEKKQLTHIHWVSETGSRIAEVRLFDKLFKSANPYDVEGDWIDDINPTSMVVCSRARVPKYVAEQAKNGASFKRYQFERNGYFIVDTSSTAKHLIFNRIVELRGTFVPPTN